jgi:hypothetical protein
MGLELLCMAGIALLFGLALLFAGYRMFLVLLPIWGFFFGLGLGAQTVQALFGGGFLSTVSSWAVGFVVGAIFAVLSYLFYIVAVAIISGSLGYVLTVAVLEAIGLEFGILAWLLGIIVAAVLAFVVLRFNIQKYAIIVITCLAGAGVIIVGLLAPFYSGTILRLLDNPLRFVLDVSWFWLLFFIVVAAVGVVFQILANRSWEVETYNRMAEM